MKNLVLLFAAFIFFTNDAFSQNSYNDCPYGYGLYNNSGICGVLSIKQILLTGKYNTSQIPSLDYEISANGDLAKAEIHFSTDGINFSLAATNTTVDNSVSVKTYYHNDSPRQSYEKIYYRIKGVDLAGSIVYSNIIMLTLKNMFGDIKAFPNPAQTFIKLQIKDNLIGTAIKIRLLQSDGKLVLEKSLRNATTIETITLPLLANGNYIIETQTIYGLKKTTIEVLH